MAVSAFEDVYDRYYPFVHRTIRRLGILGDAADDVCQDVWVVVHRRLPAFEGRSALTTWLYGIIRNVVREHRRARGRRRAAEELLADAAAPVGPVGAESMPGARVATGGSPLPGPDEAAARAEGAALLEALLDQLDEDRREVFVLTELEQWTAPEIAAAVGIPESTVYSRIAAARRAFERAVTRYHAQSSPSRRRPA